MIKLVLVLMFITMLKAAEELYWEDRDFTLGMTIIDVGLGVCIYIVLGIMLLKCLLDFIF